MIAANTLGQFAEHPRIAALREFITDWYVSYLSVDDTRVKGSVPRQASFRNPDAILGGTWEAFERVLQKAGYHEGGLRKIEASRDIGGHIDPSRNTSPSFCALRDVLRAIVSS